MMYRFNGKVSLESLVHPARAVHSETGKCQPLTAWGGHAAMKLLTDMQLDALTEVFNVGAGRAASSLSAIVGEIVTLDIPRVEIKRLADLNTAELIPMGDTVAVVGGT
jgi:chemotaxis protein CheY-P-specific phosphatase CheC